MTSPLKKQPLKPKGFAGEIDKHIGQQLKKRRQDLNMSQADIAKLLDLTFQQVQKYERGINRISAGRLYELAHSLDVPITYFFQGYVLKENKKAADKNASRSGNDAGLLDALMNLNSIKNKRLRNDVLSLIKNIANKA